MHTLSLQALTANSGVGFGTSGVRGLVSDLTDTLCYAYTAAFLQQVAGGAKAAVLGHDLRPSSPRIAAACAAAVRDAGFAVIYAGALPTPALAYYAQQLGAPALVVTGSHIPFDRNGLKFYRASGEISKQDEQRIGQATVRVPDVVTPQALPAPDPAARRAYVRRYLDFFGAGALAGLRVAVYEHSSVAREVLREILQGLGAEVIALGRSEGFVPIDTEAVRTEDIRQARQWAAAHSFDAILSTDGDADRPLIGDEQGQWLRGDMVGLLCAQYLQAHTVVTPVSSNTAVERCGLFARVIRTRIGSPYVIAAMAQVQHNGIVAGYEANGGFLLGSDIIDAERRLQALPTRDAVLPMLALLCLARARGCRLSALTRSLPARFTASDRLKDFSSEKSARLIAQFRNDLPLAAATLAPHAGAVVQRDDTDGLRLTFANGTIVHLRASGNAPELRCYTEADTQAQAQQLCAACLQQLQHSL